MLLRTALATLLALLTTNGAMACPVAEFPQSWSHVTVTADASSLDASLLEPWLGRYYGFRGGLGLAVEPSAGEIQTTIVVPPHIEVHDVSFDSQGDLIVVTISRSEGWSRWYTSRLRLEEGVVVWVAEDGSRGFFAERLTLREVALFRMRRNVERVAGLVAELPSVAIDLAADFTNRIGWY